MSMTKFRNIKLLLANQLRTCLPKQTLSHLAEIRRYEIQYVLNRFPIPEGQSILEVGAGTGEQSKIISEFGHPVTAVDLKDAGGFSVSGIPYSHNRVWPVHDYDGHKLPFESERFDVVYTSNVLEHIPHLTNFEHEIRRVLKNDGIAIHVLPSGSWRFWTCLTFYLRRLDRVNFRSLNGTLPHRHGERGNAVTEIWWFSRFAWRRHFIRAGWEIKFYAKNKLFYTGYSILDSYLGIKARRLLSYALGSSCHIFVLRRLKSCVA